MRWRVLKWKIKNSRLWRRLFPVIALAVLLIPSTSAHALTYSGVSLEPSGNSFTSVGGRVTGIWANSGATSNLTLDSNRHVRFTLPSGAGLGTILSVNTFRFPSSVSVKKDSYYTFLVGFQAYADFSPIVWNMTSTDSNFDLLSVQHVDDSMFYPNTSITTCYQWRVVNGLYQCVDPAIYSNAPPRYVVYYEFVIKAKNDGNFVPQVTNSDSIFKITVGNGADVLVYVGDLYEYNGSSVAETLDEMNQKDNQDRSDLQNQSSDTDSSADDAQAQVEDATSSMFDIIRSFNEILGTPASDCVISVQTAGLSLQNMDLCQAPSEIRTMINAIVGLIAVVASVLVSYSLVMSILDLITYAQGGDKQEGGK